jgi:hypothetical protein
MIHLRTLALAVAALALQGCVAKAVVSAVTLPVRAVGAGVDAVTTSQSEADEKRGREIRKREERLGELERQYAKQMDRCRNGNDDACDKAREIEATRDSLRYGEPER